MKEYLNGTRGDNQKQIVEMETTEANAEAKLKEQSGDSFFLFSILTGEFKLFVLLPFSAEKLVRQNSFPQTELGALIEV